MESFLKVAVCLYHRAFINGKTPIKVTVCIYHHVFINGKVISKLRYVYVTMRSSKEKSFQSRGMCISLCVNQRESRFKVALCIYHRVFINGEFISKLRYVYNIHQWGKSFQSCVVYISSRIHQWGKSFQSYGMYISSCVNRREFLKVISKLRYVYIIMRSSRGKSFQNCGM